ncbi:MAG TPA: hypothetical protein VGI71_21825 [Scandinavium sp.]|jgi:hypothetical protein
MTVRDHNRELIAAFLADGRGGDASTAEFFFNDKVVSGIDAALDLLGDDYKIHSMDRKTINNNIHAYRLHTEPDIKKTV